MPPKRSAPDLARALSLWETTLEAAGKAPSTVKAYTDAAELLVHAFGRHADPATIQVEDLEAIMATWRKLEGSTRRNRVVAWRQFYKWGSKRHGWPDVAHQLDVPKRNKPALRRLTEPEIDAMLHARTEERPRTVIWVLTYSAVRIGEMLSARWREVDLVAGRITITHVTAKGRRGRLVPIPDELVTYLASIKDARGVGAGDDCYVIPHRRRAQFIPESEATIWTRPTSQTSVGRMLKATAEAAGVRAPDEVTAHMFRRFYLERVLDDGIGMYAAAAIAGHTSIQTTAEYGGGASIEATTRAVRGLSFGKAREGTDGRTWVRTKVASQERSHADDVERFEPGRPDSGGSA